MNRDNNKKIAKWLGWNIGGELLVSPTGDLYGMPPNFTTSDSDAITLLPVIKAKTGQDVQLWSGTLDEVELWGLTINYHHYPILQEGAKPTISAAITSAVIALIDKEK